ncbi:zinc-binding dehydrogenase [Alteromonas sp. ASW11-19]|uniref:Zinc-binding dehydrogenase n=1 Tax=Alteromonas salexigens TaxID=2982530 RepID=A0ABT2VNZ8_9ALTE|nr:zinc-binding dehydrogenase [Alteromonas salexigens]MCU7555012.1 zinc-binding dehydrogenase [Alteromonas salexigens]
MRFTSAVLTQCGNPLEIIDDIQVPALGQGQVLVKIHYSGVCHSQLMEVAGARGEDKYLPHMLGHEATATVIDTGPSVTTVAPDDKVVLGWIKGTGLDAGSTQYSSPIGTINAGAVTTFSEYSVVSENRCYPLPTGIGLKEGVLFGCALPTGMGMVQHQLALAEGESIGIVGLGGIGLSALLAAVNCNAGLIVAIDTNESKLQLAKRLGAHVVLNPNTASIVKEVAEITQGSMLDHAVEAAGSCRTIELAFALIHPRNGKCVFASHPKQGEKIQLDPFELICGKKIEGSWGGGASPQALLEEAATSPDTIKPLNNFLSEEYSLQNINLALTDLKNQKVVRAIVSLNGN